MASAKHHFVPKSLLRAFCVAGDKMFYFSKRRQDEAVSLRDISQKFFKRHLYSTIRSLRAYDDRLERDFFQVLDSRFAEIVRPIVKDVEAVGPINLILSQVDFIKKFIYFQKKRTPEFLNPILEQVEFAGIIDNALMEFERLHGAVDPKEVEKLKAHGKQDDILHSARAEQSATLSEDVWGVLSKMNLCFATAPERSQFIIGSNPVVRFENAVNPILGDGNVELWVPVSPKVLVGVVGPLNHKGVEFVKLNQLKVRKVNEQIILHSDEVGSTSEQLLKSLIFSKSKIAHRH